MRKPAKDVAVKIDWTHYKRLKDEALEKDKPISKLLAEKLDKAYRLQDETGGSEQVTGALQEATELACPYCDFVTETRAGLGRHLQAKHGERLEDIDLKK